MNVNCDYCGNTISRRPSIIKIYQYHFCNQKCRVAWHKLPWDEERLKQVRELYGSGESVHKIATRFKVSYKTLWDILNKNNIPRRSFLLIPAKDSSGRFQPALARYSREELHYLLQRLYGQEELNYSQIAQELGCSHKTIRKYLVEFDLLRPYRETMVIVHAKHRKPNIKRGDGYRAIHYAKHPRAGKDGYVLEHIVVWERTHKKTLPEGWIIHHLNGDKADNRPENLMALPNRLHVLVASFLATPSQMAFRGFRFIRKAMRSWLLLRRSNLV